MKWSMNKVTWFLFHFGNHFDSENHAKMSEPGLYISWKKKLCRWCRQPVPFKALFGKMFPRCDVIRAARIHGCQLYFFHKIDYIIWLFLSKYMLFIILFMKNYYWNTKITPQANRALSSEKSSVRSKQIHTLQIVEPSSTDMCRR